ncbi:MAG TPA: cytochrome C [bacterium]
MHFFRVILFSFFLSSPLGAQISPGELAQPHADLEGMGNCTKCHTLGGGPDVQKCLDCHREIAQGLTNQRGYHFRVTGRNGKACFECHSEHNGKSFNMIFWTSGEENFDHGQTGYRLEGKHAQQKCESCHQPAKIVNDPRKLNSKIDLRKTFLGLDTKCLSCHHDEHRGQLAADCLKCHTYSGWKPAQKFSHDQAKFRLTGKHQTVECQKCHRNEATPKNDIKRIDKLFFTKFVGIEFGSCTSCHRDIHNGKFGDNCTKCHDTGGWRRINSKSFNHAMTRFPLLGLHQQVACEKCHGSGDFTKPLRFANCSDCHRDVHLGQLANRADGGRCESCHDVSGFVPAKFDMAEHERTRYPLTGAHLAVPCVVCHFVADRGTRRERRIFDFADLSCQGCHNDVHKGQFSNYVQAGGCESCHQTSAWDDVKFDHNQTRFSLFGKHLTTACTQCHKTVDIGTKRERVLYKPLSTNCVDCHRDIHFGQFAKNDGINKCERCHTPESWRRLIFNHDRDSQFRLRGAHEKVACEKCHKLITKASIQFVIYKPMDGRCESCHGKK